MYLLSLKMVFITAPNRDLYCPLSTVIAVLMECQKYLHFEVIFEVDFEVVLEVKNGALPGGQKQCFT